MPATVIDASALGAMAFGEPEAEAVAEALGDSPLIAPALIWFELANICLKKINRQPEEEDRFPTGLRRAPELQIEMGEVDYGEVVVLARRKGLSAYDASYLWLAQRLNAQLVTLDQLLDQAWKRGATGPEAPAP